MMTWGQLGLQDGNSPIMEELIFLHDFINLVLIFIISFVGLMMISMLNNTWINKNLLEMQMVESVWTILPAAILVQVALPSLLLLYMLDESVDSSLTMKAIGHQWYWSYEYSDFWFMGDQPPLEFDSYMIPPLSMGMDTFRLLDTDNHAAIPLKTHVRLLVSSADVLHAWTVPSLGVKADAVPGRINQIKFISQRPGVFYGQCSEICGANHSFMPIVLESISSPDFISWVIMSQ